MDEDTLGNYPSPLAYTIRLNARTENEGYSAVVSNCFGHAIASATASDFWTLWAMLKGVLEQEVKP